MSEPKPDDRRDNTAKIKASIDATKRNMEAADELIARTDNPKTKADLEAKMSGAKKRCAAWRRKESRRPRIRRKADHI